jgi:Protein of unknown function (DUF3225)
LQIDSPDVVAEVRAAFERYERALVTNDVATLDEIFRNDPRTIRYGQSENLYGHKEIAAFRAARPSAGLARTLSRTVIPPLVATLQWHRPFSTARLPLVRSGARRRLGFVSPKVGASLLDT